MAVLVIGAHPDDEVLGLGGTVARLARDGLEDVFVLIVTDGSSTQYPGDEQKRLRKGEELGRCCEVLGAKDYVHGKFPDMQLDGVRHTELNALIAEHIAKWRPSTVYSHFPDVNRDHVRVYESTMVATRPTPGSFVKKLVLYPTPSATEWRAPGVSGCFVANEWVDIASTIDLKTEAVACYVTELRDPPHPRSAESLRATAQAVGAKAGYRFGEEFMVVRSSW